ncbi:MAG TPA: hypothetical protein VGK63_04505 [Candidatus Limnocylindrales bacterium]
MDAALHRLDRSSPEYATLVRELERIAREVLYAGEGPGTETAAPEADPLDAAIEQAEGSPET